MSFVHRELSRLFNRTWKISLKPEKIKYQRDIGAYAIMGLVDLYNVPAVCNVWAAWIRKCAAFPGATNCEWRFAWE
jgi:hypothetical protein